MSKQPTEETNYLLTWAGHYFIDPWVVMLGLGALGHMRGYSILYTFSYWQVFIAMAVVQHFWPILITSDAKKVPSNVKAQS